MNTNKKVVILGAGISGLTTAYTLHKKGFDVKVLEKKNTAGGSMETIHDGGFLFDTGPNSGLETTPLIKQYVEDAELSGEMIYANEEGNKRYILKNGELLALPTSPGAFLKTGLFSAKAKLRLLKEPFVGKSDDGFYQSIAEFVTRRLGREFLDNAIDPFVSGVFAGNPEKLSVKSAFPKLYALEENYGGLIKGMIKGAKERKKRNEESKQSAKMFSFINGMQTFPEALAKKINGNIFYNSDVISLNKESSGYCVTYMQNGESKKLNADVVFSTIPTKKTSEIIPESDSNLKDKLENIFYPPVIVLYLGYDKRKINRPLDGFGFLIPSKERKNFLGAIWSSTIFNNRAPDGFASFTIFIGGARNPGLLEIPEEQTIKNAIREFQQIMGIKENPDYQNYKVWANAIPQYNLGYIEVDNAIEKFELENPGLFLGGNYIGGISVGDCVKNSEMHINKIEKFINEN